MKQIITCASAAALAGAMALAFATPSQAQSRNYGASASEAYAAAPGFNGRYDGASAPAYTSAGGAGCMVKTDTDRGFGYMKPGCMGRGFPAGSRSPRTEGQ